MTTIVACKKHGKVVLGADGMYTYGDESMTMQETKASKLIKTSHGVFSFAGDSVVRDSFSWFAQSYDFENFSEDIKLSLHIVTNGFLKFLEENCGYDSNGNKENSSFKLTYPMLFANADGIWHIDSQRCVSEIANFFSIGSGRQYAMGVYSHLYKTDNTTARYIVEESLKAACALDIYSGGDLDIIEI